MRDATPPFPEVLNMSDLSLQLQLPDTQLPVSSYFDRDLLALERQRLFAPGPRYVGHALAVPEVGDYFVLQHEGDGRALVRSGADKIELISNVCRHRQALMLKGQGSLNETQPGAAGGHIVCPVHRWTYDASGQLLGAPQFAQHPCLHLNNYPLRQWNGLLFEDNGRDVVAEFAGMTAASQLSFDGYALDHVEMHECHYNWKTFMEVYLEDLHVGPFHPGLGNFVTCDDLHWQYADHWSVQTVGVAPTFGKPGTEAYKAWHDVLLRYQDGQLPDTGAIWLAYYPHIMVEWYPQVLTVSSLHPLSVDRTLNVVEFFYPEEIVHFEREFVEAQQAAYMETAVEDDEIAERMDAGRRALWQRGDDEAGPYQSPLEDGMRHFHAWYRRLMDWPAKRRAG